MTDKYGRRKMIILGIGAFAVSQLLFALASQMWLLFVSRLLGGAGAAFWCRPCLPTSPTSHRKRIEAKGWG